MNEAVFFAMVADALKKQFEPSGYSFHVNTNEREITITDVIGQNAESFNVRVTTRPLDASR